jgi:hypothetical protein
MTAYCQVQPEDQTVLIHHSYPPSLRHGQRRNQIEVTQLAGLLPRRSIQGGASLSTQTGRQMTSLELVNLLDQALAIADGMFDEVFALEPSEGRVSI